MAVGRPDGGWLVVVVLGRPDGGWLVGWPIGWLLSLSWLLVVFEGPTTETTRVRAQRWAFTLVVTAFWPFSGG